MSDLWNQIATRAAVTLTDAQVALLNRYLDLLIEGNTTMNLTRITDRAEAERLHIADALTLLPHLPTGTITVADIGSGGGVPGFPLAIARPDATVLLIESTKKKAAFLRDTVDKLGLVNVEISDSRVEDLGHSPRRETFDIVTARAVAAMPFLIEWAMPLLKTGGRLLAMKGARAADELAQSPRARRLLRTGEPAVHAVGDIPGATNHVIIELRKAGRTDAKYPRPASAAKGVSL